MRTLEQWIVEDRHLGGDFHRLSDVLDDAFPTNKEVADEHPPAQLHDRATFPPVPA